MSGNKTYISSSTTRPKNTKHSQKWFVRDPISELNTQVHCGTHNHPAVQGRTVFTWTQIGRLMPPCRSSPVHSWPCASDEWRWSPNQPFYLKKKKKTPNLVHMHTGQQSNYYLQHSHLYMRHTITQKCNRGEKSELINRSVNQTTKLTVQREPLTDPGLGSCRVRVVNVSSAILSVLHLPAFKHSVELHRNQSNPYLKKRPKTINYTQSFNIYYWEMMPSSVGFYIFNTH